MNFLHRPTSDLSWFSELDRFFNPGRALASHTTFPEAIHESPEAWILRLDLPGFTKENVNLKVDNQTLSLAAETAPENPFSRKVDRQWKLGTRIDTANIKATLDQGVLEITLPKTEAPEPRQINIL
ncbi:Hsp20/alpha crystallin family protein [Luteolibacter sp. SL250]|uniref:Hsp20/alpha crystallin family protein n=1 Tax=Luteolibacter sp. SL250 TaxID=2995170 RepID=UPI00226EAD80|nr:Hsp20/alpha crystallin family protein [Luteolibacter sp. SL250]WAC17930.1 Hsp20/alpha crystallin family protein [Luteolibacter sp. SL250]